MRKEMSAHIEGGISRALHAQKKYQEPRVAGRQESLTPQNL
jgi:hypothetical protein